jgi:ribosomal protein S12 methylthiotransferase
MISLGCAKNLVDAEVMIGALVRDGIEMTNEAAQADVLIVNTCSFIDAAQEESIDAILESAEIREARIRGQGLVVSGCLPQRHRDELPALLPEVDAFMGLDQVTEVTEIVRQAFERRALRLDSEKTPRANAHSKAAQREKKPADPNPQTAPLVRISPRPRYIPDYGTPRFRLTPRHFAYLKIAEGCNHPCSFCAIPQIRGSHRSRKQSDIVAEARKLIGEGVKELNLISQDTTYYGVDLRPGRNGAARNVRGEAGTIISSDAPALSSLIQELNALPGEFWIRLLYTHPAHWTDKLIETISRCSKVARYIDIPLQHIHPNMLERMRRETSREYICDLLARLRNGLPGTVLRTTFIVGFPGETKACFDDLLQFISQARFERLGIFTYSPETGTRASKMTGQIPDKEKQRRRAEAMAVQLEVARQVAASYVGRELKVLVEGEAPARDAQKARIQSWERRSELGRAETIAPGAGHTVARGEADAPDIDCRVYIRGSLPAGEFARVKVIGHSDYDLLAEVS